MRHFYFLILLIFPALLSSQINCENGLKEVKVNLTSGQEIWKFCGELDDNGDPSGTGVLYTDKYKEEGTFKRGELDGIGKRVWNNNEQYDEGTFSNGSFVSGKRILKYDDSKITFKGDFKENKLHDKNGFYELIEFDGSKIIKTGKFIKGVHITGEESRSYSSGLEIISNYEIPTLNYTYCVDYLCGENKNKTNDNNYRIVVIVISCILFILPVIASIYLFRNKTHNRIQERQQQNEVNFDNEYYYKFNQNLYFNNNSFLNEDDSILYDQDHIYAENDFDQL